MIERKIKELSIALEALSRIQGYEATNHFTNISDLLGKAINEAKEYADNTRPPPPLPHNDDDISF